MKKYRIVEKYRITTYPNGAKSETEHTYQVQYRNGGILGIFMFLFGDVWDDILCADFTSIEKAKEYIDTQIMLEGRRTKYIEKVVYKS